MEQVFFFSALKLQFTWFFYITNSAAEGSEYLARRIDVSTQPVTAILLAEAIFHWSTLQLTAMVFDFEHLFYLSS